jgi:SepF-like predicted cell division protein (DUF552 family)
MFDEDYPMLALGESYVSHELDFTGIHIMQEVNMVEMKCLALAAVGTVYETNILMEDVAAIRTSIANGLQKLIQLIRSLTMKFQTMVTTLVGRNAIWLESVKTKINKDSIKDSFAFAIYPYWTNMSKLTGYRIPEYRETDQEFMDSLSSESSFKEKYFKDMFVKSDGESVYDPKTFFRGQSEQLSIDKTTFLSHLDNMIKFVESYKGYAKVVVDQNNKFIEIINTAASKVKTAPIQETSYLLESVRVILEAEDAAKPVTSTEVKKEEKTGEKPAEQQPDNREGEKSSGSGIRNLAASRQTYARVCYGVNSARMTVLEECYNSYVKALSLALIQKKIEPAKK